MKVFLWSLIHWLSYWAVNSLFLTYKGNTKHLNSKSKKLQLLLSKSNLVCRATRSCPLLFCKKVFLKILQNSQDKTCVGVSFLRKLQASPLKKDTPTLMLSCELCKVFKNIFFFRISTVVAPTRQRLVLLFVTNNTGGIVFVLGEILLLEPQFIIIPLLPILR